jgi:hypothetical protein
MKFADFLFYFLLIIYLIMHLAFPIVFDDHSTGALHPVRPHRRPIGRAGLRSQDRTGNLPNKGAPPYGADRPEAHAVHPGTVGSITRDVLSPGDIDLGQPNRV